MDRQTVGILFVITWAVGAFMIALVMCIMNRTDADDNERGPDMFEVGAFSIAWPMWFGAGLLLVILAAPMLGALYLSRTAWVRRLTKSRLRGEK